LLTDLLRPVVKSVEICFVRRDGFDSAQLEKRFGTITQDGEQAYLSCAADEVAELLQALLAANCTVISVEPHRESLEQLFLSEIR